MKAKAGLGSDFRALLSHGLIDQVEQIFAAVVSATGSYWPEALGSLGDVLSLTSAVCRSIQSSAARALPATPLPVPGVGRPRGSSN
jgi:hypothetical protein